MSAPDDPFKKTGEPYRPPGDPAAPGYGQAGPGPAGYGEGGYGQAGYGQGGYGGSGPGGYGPPPSTGTNGLAVAALVVGVLALFSSVTIIGGIVLGLVAIVLGVLGLRRARRGAGGRGLAGTGLGLGLVGLLVGGALLAFGISLFTSGSGQDLVSCLEQAAGDPGAEAECEAQFEEDFLN